MVLTLQGSREWPRSLATEAVSSGGRSSLGDVVPVDLFTPREKERAHEQLEHGKNLKRLLERRGTDGNTVATGRAPRRRFRPELEKIEGLRRLSGLGSELGGALGSQGGGVRGGVLNLAREGLSTVNLKERAVGIPWSWAEKLGGIVHAGAQVEEEASPGRPCRLAALAASSCVLARMRAALPARRLRWTGTGDPHRITVAGPYPPFLSFCEIRPKLELKPNCHQNESCANFYKLQIIFW